MFLPMGALPVVMQRVILVWDYYCLDGAQIQQFLKLYTRAGINGFMYTNLGVH